MISRRACLKASALSLAGLLVPVSVYGADAGQIATIHMWGSPDGTKVGFDPIGLFIEPGQTVRWVLDSSVHTTTSYHPKNGGHSLRMPEAAASWDSDYLINPNEHFDVNFTIEGVYDYFCKPHEMAGMVGRIVVGRPGGPAMLPFDYFTHDPKTAHWLAVPDAAVHAFPSVDEIMKKKAIPFSS